MGGRSAGSGMESRSSSNAGGTRIAGGSKTGDFIQTRKGVWESESQTYSAAMLVGEKREPKGILEPQFIIREGEYKGNTVYRLYEQHIARKEFLKRFKTPEEAAKWANK